MAQRFNDGARLPERWLRRVDRVFAEINVLLVAFAIGLAVLDCAYLLRWEISAALARPGQPTINHSLDTDPLNQNTPECSNAPQSSLHSASCLPGS
jgi:hypothetical protein